MNSKLGILIFTLSLALTITGCQNAQTKTTANTTSGATATAVISNTPTEAYKNLYAAVKSKNTAAIKQIMSKTTQEFATGMAEMQKKTEDDMYKNGFFESTMAPNLPALRDERIKENYGALEVQRQDGNWEDVPFVKEDESWKVAVGEVFKDQYKSPGKPASQANANTQTPQMIPLPKNANVMNNPKMPTANANAANVNANVAVRPSILNKSGQR